LITAVACTPRTEPVTAPDEILLTEAPVEERILTVLAAASLTESFTELGELFESQNPGVTVALNFAGSQQLAQQLGQGAEADVFASANIKYMDSAIESGRVVAGTSQVFANNRLVVIFPKDNPGDVTALKDLAKPGLKLDLADETVPVGKYSVEFLDKASADPAFDPQFKENALKNVVSYETTVKAVLTKVVLGEADAGIVYVSDITEEAADYVSRLDIRDALNTIATYPIAPLSDSKNPDLAQAFITMVLSSEGQVIMAKYGFIPAAGISQ
jgi:molybdate transport system substrate-binding protein